MCTFRKPGAPGKRYWSVGVPMKVPIVFVSALRSTAKFIAWRSFRLFLKSGPLVLRTNSRRPAPGTTKYWPPGLFTPYRRASSAACLAMSAARSTQQSNFPLSMSSTAEVGSALNEATKRSTWWARFPL